MINLFLKSKQIIKYLIAGGTAALVDLALLYFFTDRLGIWYLVSASLAFILSFFVSFFLQKFWTFKDADKAAMYRQMGAYLTVALINLALNAALMFMFVDGFKIWYLLAQFIASGLIAVESYFIYKHLIFNKSGQRKILIATGIYPPDIGGPAQYAKNLAEQFAGLGCGVKVLSYRLEKKLPIGLRHILYFLRVIFNLPAIDLIIALDSFSVGLPAVIAAKIFNKKIIIRTGGDFLWESYVERSGDLITLKQFYAARPALNFKEKMIFSLSEYILKNSTAIVFSTDWQKEIFEKYYGLAPEKDFIIENYFAARAIGEEATEEKKFLWAGRPLKLKNLARLSAAFSEARKIMPELKLEIIQGMNYQELLEKIKTCYAVILPSLSEVSPNFILDALSLNKPFIMTRESGFYEKLKTVGLFLDPSDREDIKNKILFLADSKNYLEFKHKAINYSYKHSWREIAAEFINLYEKL